jgi:hypothetical protein
MRHAAVQGAWLVVAGDDAVTICVCHDGAELIAES